MLSLISTMLLITNAFVIKRPNSNCQVEKEDNVFSFKENTNYNNNYNYNKGNLAKVKVHQNTNNCPKVDLQTSPNVNLTEYIRATWYVQQQQVNGYQPKSDLYCVAATYDINNSVKVPLFKGKVISVYNYANRDKVNGLALGNNSTFLCAREANQNHPEKLSVAPCFLPNLFAGPYWILAAGPSPSNYTGAVVIGGQPSIKINNTCTTKETGINNSGLWIFTHEKIA